MNQNITLDKNVLVSWLSPYDLTCTAFAVILGLMIGWLDLHTTEVTVPILSLLTAGLLLGLLQPFAAWRWAVLIVIGMTAMVIYVLIFDIQTTEPASIDILVIIVTLMFSLFGSYSGQLIRRIIRGQKNGSN